MDITHTNCPHGRTDGLACYGHTDPARDCPPPCCEKHLPDGFEDCPECNAILKAAFRSMATRPLGGCSAPGCGAEAGPLPGPTSGRDLCPEHRDDERHDLERIAERACPPCPFCSLESSRPDGPCPRCELEQGWDYWAEKQPEHLECVMNAIRDALNYWKERDGGAEA